MNKLIQALKDSYRVQNSLAKELQDLNEDLSSFEKAKKCINCRKMFSPKENTDTSCVYHPGKIKFYSCKYFFYIH